MDIFVTVKNSPQPSVCSHNQLSVKPHSAVCSLVCAGRCYVQSIACTCDRPAHRAGQAGLRALGSCVRVLMRQSRIAEQSAAADPYAKKGSLTLT